VFYLVSRGIDHGVYKRAGAADSGGSRARNCPGAAQ
jgi:hypothetical protein